MVQKDINPEDWLERTIKESEENEKPGLIHIPHRESKDGDFEYRICHLFVDQQKVVVEVMGKIQEWMTCDDFTEFKPLRLTVAGAGGTGKSVIINTIVTLMRKMFQHDGVVHVAAPTGTAAFNVGGETFHHLIKSKPTYSEYHPNSLKSNKEKRLQLINKFKCMLTLIIDERSLASCKDLGTTNRIIAETIFQGGPFPDESWGGLPVVVMFGDDYQLPSTEEGAFSTLSETVKTQKMFRLGRKTFLECAESVIFLKKNKRMQDSQKQNKKLLEKIRQRRDLSEDQVAKLLSLGLKRYEEIAGAEKRKEIEDKAVYLFYTNNKKKRHNLHKIFEVCTPDNPVAFLKPQGYGATTGRPIAEHFKGDRRNNRETNGSVQICREAKVALNGKNFKPLWGLHNGAGGIVKEIVFAKEHNPNNGDLPLYVVVHFPLYCGPAWDLNDPKAVPIPMIELSCAHSRQNRTCCKRTYAPLCLAYARTIHRFQGMSAGPVDEGKIPNMFEYIICDPHTRESENNAMGLFYTALARATTLGDERGEGSAIYFIGEDFNEARFRNIGRMKHSNTDYKRIQDRARWIEHLKQNELCSGYSTNRQSNILNWSQATTYTYDTLYERINTYIDQKSEAQNMHQPNRNKKQKK